MKRLLIVLIALAMLAAMSGAAVAAPCKVPGHPSCGGGTEPPPVGGTCEETYPDYPKMLKGTHDFINGSLEFELTKARSMACYDVTTDYVDPEVREWTVEVAAPTGEVPREMYVAIRDSAPGDSCPNKEVGFQTKIGYEAIGTWSFPGIPASVLNACGQGFDDQDVSLTFYANAANLPRNGTLEITVTTNS